MFKKLIFISFVVCLTLQSAQDSLSLKIQKLQSVPKNERFKLMNEIKRELAKLNFEQRSTALGKLRMSLQGSKPHKSMQGGMSGGGMLGGGMSGNGMRGGGMLGGGMRGGMEGMHKLGGESERAREQMHNDQMNKKNPSQHQNRPEAQNMKHRK